MKHLNRLLMTIALIFILLATNIVAYAKVTKRQGSPPAAPLSLIYSGITGNEVTLSWQASANATGYKVFRATPNDANYTLIATISATSYKSVALTSGTKYWYYVQAYNTYGTSAASTHINITTIASVPSAKKLVLGFTTYYYAGDVSSYNSMTANTSSIDEIASNTYVTDALGNISGLVPSNQISYANSNNIKTLAMITNNFDGNIAKILLESSINRQALINNILNSLKLNGYKGVNIDLEGVYYYDRGYLTSFMSEIYSALHAQGFYVTQAVPAKTSDSITNSWSGAFDYAALANYSDQIVLMTYDEHYPGGTPGAIASISWVESVIKYASSVMPKTKLLLGCAAYGYDWSANGTRAYSIAGILNLASNNNAVIKWDTVSMSPYFSYTDALGIAHNVWFENAQSINYKLDLVNSYDLAGIGIWRLGLENSDYWTSIKTKFIR